MDENYNPYVLASCLDNESKRYWKYSIIAGVAVFICGALGTVFTPLSSAAAYAASLCSAIVFWANLKVDSTRGRALELRKKLDIQDAFRWDIEKHEYNDFLIRCSSAVKKKVRNITPETSYFESKEPPGAKRALQNTRESAWWSEHLSEKMYQLVFLVTIILLAIAVITMVAGLAMAGSVNHAGAGIPPMIARIVTAFLMLLISLNLIKLTISYNNFSRKSAKCKESADNQLKKSARNHDKAIMIMYDYFIARSGSPIIPSWLWSYHRKELNLLYPYRSDDPVVQEPYAHD